MISRIFAVPAAAIALCAAAGCASVTGSRSQPVSVTTVCEGAVVNGAACTLSNDKGIWTLMSPGPATVQKSTADLAVSCKLGQAEGSWIFISKNNTNVWGNLLVGGAIGYAVDSSSGAGFDYPSNMTVVLYPSCAGLSGASPSATPATSQKEKS